MAEVNKETPMEEIVRLLNEGENASALKELRHMHGLVNRFVCPKCRHISTFVKGFRCAECGETVETRVVIESPVASDALLAGDLVLADGRIWEIIDDTMEAGDRLEPGVFLVSGHYERNGKVVAYAVRGFIGRDYNQVTPEEIEKEWRLDRRAEHARPATAR